VLVIELQVGFSSRYPKHTAGCLWLVRVHASYRTQFS
jgi:hypothetical protein